MSSRKQNPYLTVLDVGHGNAAILEDEGGVVVFDTGRGPDVDHHLVTKGIKRVQSMFLSHADIDHIGGAVTLLLNPKIMIDRVSLNPDPSKSTDVFHQLCVALCDAEKRKGTKIEPSLTTSTSTARKGATIEILHPPAVPALAGIGGKLKGGRRHTSNSLSAAIRIKTTSKVSVLLGGDVEFDCLEYWKDAATDVSATAIVFPHHGGLPGNVDASDAAIFAHEIAKLVSPSIAVFSIHRTLHENPRSEVLKAVSKATKDIRFICTQLPDRFHSLVHKTDEWSFHRQLGGKGILEGCIEIEFQKLRLKVAFKT